jgi:hypothetical protein
MEMKNGSGRLATLLGIAISGVFLYFAFRDLEAEKFWDSLGSVNLLPLIAAVALYFVAVAIIALRWQYLLRAVRHVPLLALTELVTICYMGNGLYPLRAGEALRIYLLRRNHQVPVSSATATVMVERAFDGTVMLAFILFSLVFIDLESKEIDAILSLAGPLFIGAVVLLFALAANPNLLRKIVTILLTLLPERAGESVSRHSEGILSGLAGLREPTHIFGAVFCSLLTWTVEACVYWLVMFAFGLNLGFSVALLVIGAVNLAGIISAAPGQVGVYEFVVSAILIALGVPLPVAASYAIIVHLVIWLPTTLIGFALLLRQGMGWTEITRARELEQKLTRKAER